MSNLSKFIIQWTLESIIRYYYQQKDIFDPLFVLHFRLNVFVEAQNVKTIKICFL